MKKICTNCKNELPFKDFNKKKTNKDGFQNICRKCSNESSKKYYRLNKENHIKAVSVIRNGYIKRNKQVVEWAKLKHGCALCEESDPCCIDCHHLGGKDKNVSQLVAGGYGLPTLLKEINKCVCVCSNCHRKIHAGRLSTDGLTAMSLQESDIKVTIQTLELKE